MRDLDPYLGDDDDQHLTPEQQELKRLRQLDQHMTASQEDMQKIQMMKMTDEAEHIKRTDPGFVADLKRRGKSVEQFVLDKSYRPDLYQQQYDKSKREFLDKLYDEGNKLRMAPVTPTQQQDDDFWGDKPPASPPEGGEERAAAYNELQKENPQAITCDDKVEEQFRALTGMPPKKPIRR